MAELLGIKAGEDVSILDAGAGAGALSDSILERVRHQVQLTMVERDAILADHLAELLAHYPDKLKAGSAVVIGDFIEASVRWRNDGTTFTHIIMNPPYERIRLGSTERENLRSAGLVASNMYAAFLWVGMDLLRDGGRMVAVVPRSVLSGAQFRLLRKHLFSNGSLFRLHHFRSRRRIFHRDSVQQEVVVFGIAKGVTHAHVRFSQSNDLGDIWRESVILPARRFKDAGGDDVILVPTGQIDEEFLSDDPLLPPSVEVSVGSVVDFRLPEGALNERADGIRLVGSEIFAKGTRPERWIRQVEGTSRLVMPPGKYVVIKRISPPETNLRLKHRIIDATAEGYCDGVAFENHVLVLHSGGAGLSDETCTLLDERLRADAAQQQIQERTGSTQINAADVRALRRTEAQLEGETHDG